LPPSFPTTSNAWQAPWRDLAPSAIVFGIASEKPIHPDSLRN
jgi:hypothetical protein